MISAITALEAVRVQQMPETVVFDKNKMVDGVTNADGSEPDASLITETNEVEICFDRTDTPGTGRKRQNLWIPNGDRTLWHMTGGIGNGPLVLHVQVRPNSPAH